MKRIMIEMSSLIGLDMICLLVWTRKCVSSALRYLFMYVLSCVFVLEMSGFPQLSQVVLHRWKISPPQKKKNSMEFPGLKNLNSKMLMVGKGEECHSVTPILHGPYNGACIFHWRPCRSRTSFDWTCWSDGGATLLSAGVAGATLHEFFGTETLLFGNGLKMIEWFMVKTEDAIVFYVTHMCSGYHSESPTVQQ